MMFSKCGECGLEIQGAALTCPCCRRATAGCNQLRYLRLWKYRSLAHKCGRIPCNMDAAPELCQSCAFNHTRRILTEHEIWYSKPEQFNDPFECRFDVSAEASLEEKLAVYFRYLVVREHEPPDIALQRAKAEVLGRTKAEMDRWEEHRKTYFRKSIADHGICCLSDVNDDILMWSHYADGHCGVCIEFTADVLDESHCEHFTPLPVSYEDSFPSLHLYSYGQRDELVSKSVLTKARDWQYEGEYRLLDAERAGVHLLPENVLTGVILGPRVSDGDREEVSSWVAEHPTPLRVYQAGYRPGHYALDVRPVEMPR